METSTAILISIFMFIIRFIVCDSIPSKYAKLAEGFSGLIGRRLLGFVHEKSTLHTKVYGGTGTGKAYFVRQYLKLYGDETAFKWLNPCVFREIENMVETMTGTMTRTMTDTETWTMTKP